MAKAHAPLFFGCRSQLVGLVAVVKKQDIVHDYLDWDALEFDQRPLALPSKIMQNPISQYAKSTSRK